MSYSKWHLFGFFIAVFIGNLVLSAWMAYSKPVLGYDGILYVLAAEAIGNKNWELASELYSGSLYPFLIYLSSSLSKLSTEHAAHLFNALCFVCISFAYIAIVNKLGGRSRKIMLIAAMVIIFFPSLIRFRPYIFRDYAFLSCYLWSIYFLLCYYKDNRLFDLAFWAGLLGVATLFRKEGIVFLVFLSVVVVFSYAKKQLQAKGYGLPLIIGGGGMVVFFVVMFFAPLFLSARVEPNVVLTTLSQPSGYIVKVLKNLFLSNDGFVGVLSALCTSFLDVVYETLRRLELIYAFLAIYAIKKSLALTQGHQRSVVGSYAVIAFFILVLFDVSLSYLTSRYVLALTLTILLVVPFALEDLFNEFSRKTKFKKACLILLLMILTFLSIKRFVLSEQHIEATSGQWAVEHISADAVIASNNSKILYYAGRHPYNYIEKRKIHIRYSSKELLSKRNKKNFAKSDYLFFLMRVRNQQDIDQNEEFKEKYGLPIKTFEQNEEQYVNVYKIK